MARWKPVPVVGGAYTDDCRPWASQDCVNRIPVMAEREGTRSPAMLRDAPGCAVFCILGSNAPVRKLHNAEGRLFSVSGQSLYQVSTGGAPTSLGTIPGVGRCVITHNQIANGNEVVIANGQAGYVWNTVTSTLTQITDPGFPGAKVVDFCDGYIMFIEPQGRYWGHSELADAMNYNTLDRAEAEAQPDKIVTGIVSHRQWIVFGERSTEFYDNTGAATGTFQRTPGTAAEVGAAGTHAVAKLDNTVFVVGHDGIGYRLDGYQFVRVTTHAIEQAWARCNLSQTYCTTFDDRGHKVWYVTMTDGQTWGFDVATGEWHRRKSYGLDFWRMSDLVRWNGVWIGGDYSNGQLYQLDWRLSNDAGQPLERSRTFAVMHDSQNRVQMNALELVYDTGMTQESPPLPQLIVPSLTVTGDLTDGRVGDTKTGTYTATGGVPTITFAESGGFPAGLTLASDGSWSGIVTAPGTYSWTVTATDSVGTTGRLADMATFPGEEIFTWTMVPDELAQSHVCAYVDDGVIVIGGNNNSLTYTTDQGSDWTVLAGEAQTGIPGSVSIGNVKKFDGKLYMFRNQGASGSFCVGNSMVFSALANAPSLSACSVDVFGGALYGGDAASSTNFRLRKMVTHGDAWSTIDTGITKDSTSNVITCACQSGSAYLFGTDDGKVFRTLDFITFTLVLDIGTGTISNLAALGGVVIVTSTGGAWYRSADDGATFGSVQSTPQLQIIGATRETFFGGYADNIETSPDAVTWTNRYTNALAPGSAFAAQGASDGTLAVLPRDNNYAAIGTT